MIPRACRVVQCWHAHVYKLDTPTLTSDMTKTKQIRYAYKYDTPTLAKLYDIKTRYDIQ